MIWIFRLLKEGNYLICNMLTHVSLFVEPFQGSGCVLYISPQIPSGAIHI